MLSCALRISLHTEDNSLTESLPCKAINCILVRSRETRVCSPWTSIGADARLEPISDPTRTGQVRRRLRLKLCRVARVPGSPRVPRFAEGREGNAPLSRAAFFHSVFREVCHLMPR